MRRTPLLVLLPSLILLATVAAPVRAGDEDPSMEELARMVLEGTDAEQAMVTRWIEVAGPDTLRELFRAVRARRRASEAPAPAAPLELRASDAARVVVNVEARVIEVPAAAAVRLLAKAPRPEPGGSVSLAYLDDADVRALLAGVAATEGAAVLSSPRITVYDRQKANVQVLSEVSFVQDYDVETGVGGKPVADPIIGVLKEGLVLDVTPAVSEDRRHVTLELEGAWSHVRRPIPEFKTRVGETEVTIQLPELTVRRARSTIRLPQGGSALLRPEAPEDATVETVILVRTEVIRLDGEQERALGGDGAGRPPRGR